MRTAFEQGAHDIQYKKKSRPSFPHTIETYTGNNKSTFWDAIGTIAAVVFCGILLVLLMAIFPD